MKIQKIKLLPGMLSLLLLLAGYNIAQAQNRCVSFPMTLMSEFESEFKKEIADILTKDDALSKDGEAESSTQKQYGGKPKPIRQARPVPYTRPGEKKPADTPETKEDKMNELIDRLDKFWTEQLGSSWAHVGARHLRIPDSGQHGNISVGTERTFITTPNLEFEDVLVKITKTGGKSRGTAYVCRASYDDPNHWERVGSAFLRSGSSDIGVTKEILVEGCKGYHLSVRIAKRVGTNRLAYKVETEGIE